MKPRRPFQNERILWQGTALLALGTAVSTLSAAETNAPETAVVAPLSQQELFEGGGASYDNWIELSTGGFITSGSKAQFQQTHQSVPGPFGGISDFHYQHDLDKTTTVTADGHALIDEHDYKLSLGVTREKIGFLKVTYDQFRTWYNGDGGFYPPSGAWYPLSESALALDRGSVSFEAGLRLENVPNITFKYTHDFRNGQEGSTSWGYVNPPGSSLAQGLSPSILDIDEHSDAFQLDVTHRIKSTDISLGLRYETGKLNDALEISQYPGEPVQEKITDREGTTYDLLSANASTETWIRKNLLLSTGYSFSDLDSGFSGSRIYGSDFDVGYVPAAQNGFGYLGLSGGSRLRDYVMDLNLLWKPSPQFSIVPSLRVQKEDLDSSVNGQETLAADPAIPFDASGSGEVLDVRERLDVRYTGVTNWVFSARGDWTEGEGNLNEAGGLGPVEGIGVPGVLNQTDDARFFQKYSVDARWYPLRRVSVDAGGYYKIDDYHYDNNVDSTPNNSATRYPGYLVIQDFETYDANVGLTLRPWQNVTLISRYEYQWSTIHTAPDPVSGLDEVESSEMRSHILSQSVSWIPWSRLNLQATFNYVLSTTKTPASDYTQAVLAAQNNYWTLSFSSGLVLDDKTDLNLDYFYYRANDYSNDAGVGVPYGAGTEEQGVTASLVRRINKHLRLSLKYGYYRYQDELSGGQNNYEAQLLYSSLQYRF